MYSSQCRLVALCAILLFACGVLAQSEDTLPDEKKYECLRFDDELNLEAEQGNRQSWLHGSKTTYLRAREAISKAYNSTWPEETNTCQPVYLYLLGRHSIRFQSTKEINKVHTLLPDIAQRVIQSKRLSQKVLLQLAKWQPLYHPHQDQHVTESGKFQSAVTAGIFYKHFPTLLDIERNFEVGVSYKPRTKETAKAFIKSLVDMQISGSDLSYDKAKSKAEKVIKKKFPIHKEELLHVHERCKPLKNESSPEYLKLVESETYQNLSKQFSASIGLSSPLPLKTVQLIAKVCSYETAFYDSSVWCDLFSSQQWNALSYMENLEAFTDANEFDLYHRMSCVTIVDLISKLKAAVTQKDTVRSTLYFGHDTFIKGLFSFLRLFAKSPPNYKLDQSGRVCVPRKYDWVTSLIAPFGTNLAVSLYRCDDQQYKLFTAINEIPMPIRGCPTGFCQLDQFLNEFNDLALSCDIEQICPLEQRKVD